MTVTVDPADAPARQHRAWPLQAYFAVLVAVFVVAAAAAAVYVHVQSGHDERQAATADARFSARTAAGQLGEDMGLVKTTVRNLAANPQVAKGLAHPAGCTLTFGNGGADASHLEILQATGKSVCTSRHLPGATKADYAGASWLAAARRGPIFRAPVADPLTHTIVALTVYPLAGGKGFVAGFVDLRPLGPKLATLYGGGNRNVFLVTTSDNKRVVARSLDPGRWVGASLAGTSFAAGSRGPERRDLVGKTRIFQQATVPGLGWKLYVGIDKADAVAAGSRLEHRQLWIIVIGLLGILLASLLVYRRVARPIELLGAAVRASGSNSPRAPVPTRGPSEVAALADDINGLIASANRESLERRRAEEQVGMLAAIVESTQDAVIGKSLDGTIESWNAGAEGMYGYTVAEAAGQSIAFIMAPDVVGELPSMLERVSQGKAIEDMETVHIRKDGQAIDVSLTISPIKARRRRRGGSVDDRARHRRPHACGARPAAVGGELSPALRATSRADVALRPGDASVPRRQRGGGRELRLHRSRSSCR